MIFLLCLSVFMCVCVFIAKTYISSTTCLSYQLFRILVSARFYGSVVVPFIQFVCMCFCIFFEHFFLLKSCGSVQLCWLFRCPFCMFNNILFLLKYILFAHNEQREIRHDNKHQHIYIYIYIGLEIITKRKRNECARTREKGEKEKKNQKKRTMLKERKKYNGRTLKWRSTTCTRT